MPSEIVVAIVTGLLTMMGWGLADFFAKKTIDAVGDVVSLVWAHVFGTAVLSFVAVIAVVFFNASLGFPTDARGWGLLAFFGALQAFVYFFAYQGFGKGPIAVLNPVFASYSGLAALLSILVFGEVVSTGLLVALAVIFVGIILLSVDIEGLRNRRIVLTTPGLKEVGAAAILAASWTILWDSFVSGKDWLAFALCMYGFMTLTMCGIAKAKKVELKVSQPNMWKFLVLIGVCETVAYLALSLGFSTTTYTSVVALLAGAFSLPTIILARIFLKERVNTAQTIGSGIIIAGIILLSVYF